MDSSMWKKPAATLLAFLLAQPGSALFGRTSVRNNPGTGTSTPSTASADDDGPRGRRELVHLLREKVKYVFVFYQENRSFDSYFGTFPGADGLFTRDADHTPGFNQQIVNTDGSTGMIHPFRIGPQDACPLSTVNKTIVPACYAADTDDIDHSHPRIVAKMDVQNGTAQMDMFAFT